MLCKLWILSIIEDGGSSALNQSIFEDGGLSTLNQSIIEDGGASALNQSMYRGWRCVRALSKYKFMLKVIMFYEKKFMNEMIILYDFKELI